MKRYLRGILVIVLTVGLMAFFLRNAEPARVWEAIVQARIRPLALAVGLTVVTYVIRIERWRVLLLPMAATRFGTAGRATIIGFAVNAILPGRVGEVLRPYLLSTRESVTASAAFATVVIERLLDLLAIVLVLAIVVAAFHPPTADPRLLAALRTGALVTGLGTVGASLGVLWLASRPQQAERITARLAGVLPPTPRRIVTGLFQRFLVGLAVVQRPATLVVAMGLSLVLWGGIASSIWAATIAVGIDVSFAGAVVLMGFTAIGVSLPTPAGAGGYHAAYQLGATSLYGAGQDQAVAAALINHVIAFGPVTLLGLALMAHEGLRLQGLSTLGAASEAAASSAPGDAAGSVGRTPGDDEEGSRT